MNGQEEGRLHTSVLVGPNGERRKHRKARRQAAAQVEADARQARKAEAKAKWDAEQAEKRNTVYLPAAGESGPAAGR